MKYREILLDQLSPLPYFSKEDIASLGRQYDLRGPTLDTHISRSLARKDLLQLKKGMYVTADYFGENRADSSYTFYLANVLRTPSYITSWTALQYYSLTTEAIQTITSATPKVTRAYRTKAGHFTYHSIDPELFSGYTLIKGKFGFFIASPSKALFDLLYFKTRQFRGVRADAVMGIVEELRVDFDEMDKKDQKNFHRLIREYRDDRE